MKEIFTYLQTFIREGNKKVLLVTTCLVAFLVIVNYTVGIEKGIRSYPSPLMRVLGFFLLYAFVFTACYTIKFFFSPATVIVKHHFYYLLLLCPLLFGLKISLNLSDFIANPNALPWVKFWLLIMNWPVKCLLLLSAIYGVWKLGGYEKPVAGISSTVKIKPYLLLLLAAVPLLAIAGPMDQFQAAYPKVKNIAFIYPHTSYDVLCKVIFEISYGTDFLTIESFFRGLLVLAFVRYVGKDAVLPMAAFYCTIHFGKPLFECITSYFGGIMLGVIVYYTRSIWGSLIVHLGIAWLMEVASLMFANGGR